MTYNKNNEFNYWTKYYRDHKESFEPSFFSKSITKFLNEGDSLIDLGCGNGRDSIYFTHKNIYTHGVDYNENTPKIIRIICKLKS
jgi:cyclopropane fatty-acyl-phospholipid synthase-like methyltransferase